MTIPDNSVVFLVDDEPGVRAALKFEIETIGYRVQAYGSAEEFLKGYASDRVACLVLDIRMPDMSGLELLRVMRDRKIRIPIIGISGHSRISEAVEAMKLGAIDFLTKPVNEQQLIDLINRALKLDLKTRETSSRSDAMRERLQSLTRREAEVLSEVVRGASSKEIADKQAVSVSTVETHRNNILRKTGMKNVVQLVLACAPLLEETAGDFTADDRRRARASDNN